MGHVYNTIKYMFGSIDFVLCEDTHIDSKCFMKSILGVGTSRKLFYTARSPLLFLGSFFDSIDTNPLLHGNFSLKNQINVSTSCGPLSKIW